MQVVSRGQFAGDNLHDISKPGGGGGGEGEKNIMNVSSTDFA